MCKTCQGFEDVAPDPKLLKALKWNKRAVPDAEDRWPCLAITSENCERTFSSWKNGQSTVRKICRACFNHNRSETVAKTRELKAMLKESRGKVEEVVKRTELVFQGETYPMSYQDDLIRGRKSAGSIIEVDFTGREPLLTKLKRIAFNSIRSPEEMLLWLVDECFEAKGFEP
jgi:hypothetical protein